MKIDLSQYTDSYSLMAPGPVNLHPDVQKTLAEPMIHHRTPEFDQIFAQVKKNLQPLFANTEEVFILSSTGSGGMEALLVNVLTPGDSVLAIVSGKFGERWANMCDAFGYKTVRMNIPWGEVANPDEVKKVLQQNPDIQAVLCQACETSTGVAHPIQKLGEVISHFPHCLFLVDGITAAGAYPVPMSAWHIDGLVAGSQKAFMLPTGLSFVSFSKKAWARSDQQRSPSYYWDLRKEKAANAKGETYFSSSVALIKSLNVVLKQIQTMGLEKHYQQIQRRSDFCKTFLPKIHLPLFSNHSSPSMTAVRVPAGVDSTKMRQSLEDRFHITVMGGQDQLKGQILRIGHMGYIQDWELLKLLNSLGTLMQEQLKDTHLALTDILNEAEIWLQKHAG